MKRANRLFSLVVCIFMTAAVLFGCTQTTEPSTAASVSPTEAASAQPSEPTPNYTDKILEVTFLGTTEQPIVEDVVTPEIIKKTGVKLTVVDGPADMSMEQKLNLYIQSGDMPDIILMHWEFAPKLRDAGKLLTFTDEELAKYAPDINIHLDAVSKANIIQPDGVYLGVPAEMSMSEYDKQQNPNFPDATGDWLAQRLNWYEPLFRDDILKQIFPNAKTFDELYQTFKANGNKLTEKDCLIDGLQTADQLIDYFRKVKALNLQQDGKPVKAFNMNLNFMEDAADYGMGGMEGVYSGIWNYCYYNNNDMEMQNFLENPKMKDMYKKWNAAAREGLFDSDAIIAKQEQRVEDAKSGIYAVVNPGWDGYGCKDLNDAAAANNRTYKYRPVYFPYVLSHDFPGWVGWGAGESSKYVMTNGKLTEADVPKMLNYFNFFMTQEGADLVTWGPESAGLWSVVDGKRKFNTKELEDSAVYWKYTEGGKDVKYYGLCNGDYGANYDRRYYTYYNTFCSQTMPRVQAWPLPLSGDENDMYAILGSLDTTNHVWMLDPAQGVMFTAPELVPLATPVNATMQKIADEIMPKVMFAKTDAEFEQYFQMAIDTMNTDGKFPEYKAAYDKAVQDYFKAHPDLKPLPWPVK